jgi:predicted ATPase
MIKKIRFQQVQKDVYPYNIKAFKDVKELSLSKGVTIFVGDNGSGKSTLLKAIAYYNNSINVSSQDINSSYYQEIRDFSKTMKVEYLQKTRKGFFFSGEEFITYINNIKHMKQELKDDLARVEIEYKDKSEFTKGQARMAYAGQLHALETAYDKDLKEQSHGEGFLSFFKARMHQKGIYLLDEPETPLSAINQYQLVVLITDLVRAGSQVIIATHSPIIMAIKDALIYQFTNKGVQEVQYDDIEHVNFMKHFLNNKENYIDRL